MAIVKMKRLHVLALESDRDQLFDRLQALGCVQVSEQTERLSDPDWAGLCHRDESSLSAQQDRQALISGALSALDRCAPAKTGLLTPLPQVLESELFNDSALEDALSSAEKIQGISRDLLCYAMQILRCCRIVAHVHDELIIETDAATSLDAICEQMGRTPPWAGGLLLRADGYECAFYQKD